MLTLLTYPAAFDQYSGSPFCVKAAYMLHLSGQDWKRSDLLDPRKMPHKKLPVLRTPERLIPDSDGIRCWLETQGAEFDQGLTDVQKGQSRALIRMAEEHLYFQLVYDRWANDAVWPILRGIFFDSVPSLIRKPISNSIRRSVLKGLETQGVARFSHLERMSRIECDLEAITAFLWQKPFLMGDGITSADLSVGPVLAAIRATPVETPFQQRVGNDPVLSEYISRLERTIRLI